MAHILQIQYGVRQRGGTGERLVPPCRELAHQGPVRAGAEKQEVPRRTGSGIDGVSGGFEGQQHLMALFGGDGLLHLVHDQHHITVGLVHHFGEGRGQGRSARFAQLLQLKPEAKAHPSEIQPPEPAQPGQSRRGWRHQVRQHAANGGLNQSRRAELDVAPQVHVDHHRTFGLQVRHKIPQQEGGFARTTQPRHEQPRPQALVEHAGVQQTASQLSGQLGGGGRPQPRFFGNYTSLLIMAEP